MKICTEYGRMQMFILTKKKLHSELKSADRDTVKAC